MGGVLAKGGVFTNNEYLIRLLLRRYIKKESESYWPKIPKDFLTAATLLPVEVSL